VMVVLEILGQDIAQLVLGRPDEMLKSLAT